MTFKHASSSNSRVQNSGRAISMLDRAMIEAVTLGLDTAAAQFLSEGANPNGVDEDGVPILHRAFSYDSDEEAIESIARMMIAAGANPRAPHGAGPGLPERVIRVFGGSMAERLIHLIASLGFDLDAQDGHGRSALMRAIEEPRINDGIIEALLRGGADPGLKNKVGKSAYDEAKSRGRESALLKMAAAQERLSLEQAVSDAEAPSKKRAPL